MRNQILLLLIAIPITLSSCFKKIYLASDKELQTIVAQNTSLQAASAHLADVNKDLEKINDSLTAQKEKLDQDAVALHKQYDALVAAGDDERIQIARLFVNYFDKLVELSKNNLPPCANAANGWFHDRFVQSPDFNTIGHPEINPQTKIGAQLLDLYVRFVDLNNHAFQDNRNYQPPFAVKFRMVVFNYAGNIFTICKDIVQLVLSAGDQKLWAATAKDLAEAYQKEIADKKCYNGQHMNGWVAAGVQNAGNVGFALSSGIVPVPGSDADKMVAVLSKCFSELVKLPTQGHDPWLTGPWQISYEEILFAASTALKGIH